ncbi:hypothetical protein LX32DRAFT_635257 [Colletotrichum zoysiae]|uniref:Uncharacterized protein n=1 Tax=Colletotrichum zoysiae TaxID=1216348 RepID=A0AAD9HQU5_9PEZI|nr:hypothetical protein LX32DRAFT_635257 [Colletotrichum zoysiae]
MFPTIRADKLTVDEKGNIDVSGSHISNETFSRSTLDTREIRAEISGQWTGNDNYDFNNLGVAVVTSATADVYALRLRLRARRPLVAYRLQPSNLPPDHNIITFPINKAYTKQGCLDGRRGLEADLDYLKANGREQSYYKPVEAYAMKKRIVEERQALQAEFETYQAGALDRLTTFTSSLNTDFSQGAVPGFSQSDSDRKFDVAKQRLMSLPSRAVRNLVNEYVWSAQGGFYSLSQEAIDYHQTELGSSLTYRGSIGGGLNSDVVVGMLATSLTSDLMAGMHLNLTNTKDSSEETTVSLLCDLAPSMDLRVRNTEAGGANTGAIGNEFSGLRPGAVDGYRWMTFMLEPDAENTRVFFRQVVDPLWLSSSADPGAVALRSCTNRDTGRAWRVMHHVTYVSRVLPRVTSVQDQLATATDDEPMMDIMASDVVAANFQLLKSLAPIVSVAKSQAELPLPVREGLSQLFPTLAVHDQLVSKVIELAAKYYDVPA